MPGLRAGRLFFYYFSTMYTSQHFTTKINDNKLNCSASDPPSRAKDRDTSHGRFNIVELSPQYSG